MRKKGREWAWGDVTRHLLTLRTVACTDGNVSLLFEVLLASTPAYTTLGHVHSRGREETMLTSQTMKAITS